ncbi:hypothetical protein [Streptomyces sp. GC420]|uniref:hypothetical protein n=1 Tax=Streptomyces sp. GC420 TaxID=2697568 RepID=UPI0028BEA6C7|nr:hypothetical protein [Streptomyces sp. GC420]
MLGLVGGTAVGYGVQAQRPATPLPALSQPGLGYPAESLPKDKAPDPLSDKEDRGRRTEGDLRKLIVAKPKGARESRLPVFEGGTMPVDGWLSTAGYSLEFVEEDLAFQDFVEDDIRRIAATDWARGEYGQVAVRLVQFRDGAAEGARYHAESQIGDASSDTDAEGYQVKGSGNARYFVYPVRNKPGYLPSYEARAAGYRGDVMFAIHIFDTKPISKKDIRTLAEQQLERL